MSQQINLLNPALRPQRDWMSLPVVTLVVLAVLVVEIGFYIKGRMDDARLTQQKAALASDAKQVQEDLLVAAKALADQRPDPALTAQIEELTAAVEGGEQVLAILRSMNSGGSFTGYFQGFSRQAMTGLWLTEIRINSGDLSIKGRLQDANLLPSYIRRLNGDPTFQGRQFSALDMHHVEASKPAVTNNKEAARAIPAFTEFTLQGEVLKSEEAKR